MPRLRGVRVTYRPAAATELEIDFTTTLPLADVVDTAVLRIVARGTWQGEFSIRLERTRVVDVHVWIPESARRIELPTDTVSIVGVQIRCAVPHLEGAFTGDLPLLRGQLIVNGALVQSDVHVATALAVTSHRQPQRERATL